MLFETQAKANNFIKFNRDLMIQDGRKPPVRSYYCEICGGYHVTSNNSMTDAKLLDKRDKALAERVDRNVKANQEHRPTADISKKLEQLDILITKGMLDEAEKLLAECRLEMQMEQLRHGAANTDGYIKRMRLMERLTQKLEKLKILKDLPPEEQKALLAKEAASDENGEVSQAIMSICAVGRIKQLMKGIHAAIKSCDFQTVRHLAAECQKEIKSIHGPGKKQICKTWNKRLQYALHLAKVARQEAEKEAAKQSVVVQEEIESFDSVLDALYGKPGSPEREAFRREALEYIAEKDF